MQRPALERLDSFPYRHRLSELMTSPIVTVPPATPLAEAVRRMDRLSISSVLVAGEAPGLPSGIVTERDLLRATARHGAAALDMPVVEIMDRPVQALPSDAFVYRAIGRMDRLGMRHIVVTDEAGRAVGIVTARTLLRQRASRALVLGDEISAARDAAELAHVHEGLPALARALLAEGVSPLDIAGVVSEVMRDMTARAAELSAVELESRRGPAPAPWCVLILGSGGRGESLLAPDQDNALVHAGRAEDDPWYAELGEAFTALLDRAGMPYCKGGVMASNPAWRHDLEGWKRLVDRWIALPLGESLLNVDIFYDFQPVFGARPLALELRRHALGHAAASHAFLKNLGTQLDGVGAPLGLFGFLRTVEGRLDLKLNGLWPVVAAARVLALRHGIEATATADRLRALGQAGRLAPDDIGAMRELQQLATALILDQQIADIEAGLAPSSRIDPKRLDRATAARLRAALGRVGQISWMVQDALAGS